MNDYENDDSEMLEEYDFSDGIRGKYFDRVSDVPMAAVIGAERSDPELDSE